MTLSSRLRATSSRVQALSGWHPYLFPSSHCTLKLEGGRILRTNLINGRRFNFIQGKITGYTCKRESIFGENIHLYMFQIILHLFIMLHLKLNFYHNTTIWNYFKEKGQSLDYTLTKNLDFTQEETKFKQIYFSIIIQTKTKDDDYILVFNLLGFRKQSFDFMQLILIVKSHHLHILPSGIFDEGVLLAWIGINDSGGINSQIQHFHDFCL